VRARLLAAAGALLLAGCAAGPGPTPSAAPPLPPAFWTPQGAAAETPADWWRRRAADPALARLIDAALANAPDLAAALARVESARAGLRASEAERLPSLGGTASATFARTAPAEFGLPDGFDIETERIVYRAGVEGSWDADLFGRLRADQRAAAARLDAASLEAAAVRLTLVTDVARNFVAVRAAGAREAVVRRNVGAAEDLLSVTRSRVRAGLVPGIDAVRGESLLAEAAAALPPLQGEQSARIAALAVLTGLAPAEIAALVAAAPAEPDFGAPAAGVPSDLLLRRPDIAAALARVAAADADTAAAFAARFPRLSITGTIGLVATSLGAFFTGDALTAAAGPALAGPLLDFGRNQARVAGAQARAAEAAAAYRGTVLRAFGEVEANLAAIEARRRQHIALARLVAANEDAAGIARIQYRRGLADFLPVLDAERAALRAREQLIAVEAERADAEIALFRAIGGDVGEAGAQTRP
jgi:NodT family efflux transporter outer membrane factor (OMF) lipoprotein